MRPDELVGKRVLVLLLSASESARQALFCGTVRAVGADIVVTDKETGGTIQVPGIDVQRDGFAPSILPRLVEPDRYLELAKSLAEAVAWCIPVLTPDRPAGAHEAPDFIAGLVLAQDGRVLLMQVR